MTDPKSFNISKNVKTIKKKNNMTNWQVEVDLTKSVFFMVKTISTFNVKCVVKQRQSEMPWLYIFKVHIEQEKQELLQQSFQQSFRVISLFSFEKTEQ